MKKPSVYARHHINVMPYPTILLLVILYRMLSLIPDRLLSRFHLESISGIIGLVEMRLLK